MPGKKIGQFLFYPGFLIGIESDIAVEPKIRNGFPIVVAQPRHAAAAQENDKQPDNQLITERLCEFVNRPHDKILHHFY
nr:hypothetical protein [uncultured Noviherbaspirillum sp.]